MTDDTPADPGGPAPPPRTRAETLALLAQLIERQAADHLRLARYWIRRLRVDPFAVDAEGAVAQAWLNLQGGIGDHGPGSSLTPDQLEGCLHNAIIRSILDQRRRQRGRARTVLLSLARAEGDDFDLVDPAPVRAEDRVAGAEEAEFLLDMLGRVAERLRRIASLSGAGRTHREIARELAIPIIAVERALGRIRAILGPHRGRRPRSAGHAGRGRRPAGKRMPAGGLTATARGPVRRYKEERTSPVSC